MLLQGVGNLHADAWSALAKLTANLSCGVEFELPCDKTIQANHRYSPRQAMRHRTGHLIMCSCSSRLLRERPHLVEVLLVGFDSTHPDQAMPACFAWFPKQASKQASTFYGPSRTACAWTAQISNRHDLGHIQCMIFCRVQLFR